MYLRSGIKEECSGCTACENICPKGAIKMFEDEEGFKYPRIDREKCIECGACYKICPNVKKDESKKIIKAYGAKHKNENERETSRSGAAFIALSDYILSLGGVIYGVEQTKDFNVVYNRATNKSERDIFKGSKYVQSDMNEVIQQVKNDLENNKKVLFSGTPCQTAGVISCIPKKYQENLYTCDLLCHGVPSKKIFRDFLSYIENLYGKKIKDFNFRNKKFGWDCHYETSILEDGEEVTTQYFRDLFYSHNILRPSCHSCNYANTHRLADITIADFWCLDKIEPDFIDNKGVSLILVNNEKGEEWFQNSRKDLNFIECSVEECIKYTYNLQHPTPVAEHREEFWEDYKNKEFKYIIEKYTNQTT